MSDLTTHPPRGGSKTVATAVLLSTLLSTAFGFAGGVFASDDGLRAKALSALFPGVIAKPGLAQVKTSTSEGDVTPPTVTEEVPEDPIVDMVEQAAPAVVSIVISKDVPVYERRMVNPFGDDPNMNQFFGNFMVPQIQQKGTERQDVGAGSGYLVSADGYIITNRHVVLDEAAEYTVTLTDKRKLVAKVVARDELNDIAVLKVEATGLPFLTFADSDKLKVGQRVVAIGFALGQFSNTVSSGIISGLARSISAAGGRGASEDLYDVIQTDTAINPGNSGGPLLDIKGHVVGMNVAIVQGSQNIGFAIPANDVLRAYGSVKATGKIERAYLGVRYVMITKDLVEKNQLAVDEGALVARGAEPGELAIAPGSPADIAGIVENDIVLEIDGKKLTMDYPLAVAVSKAKAGDTLKIKVLHKGVEKTVDVTLTARK